MWHFVGKPQAVVQYARSSDRSVSVHSARMQEGAHTAMRPSCCQASHCYIHMLVLATVWAVGAKDQLSCWAAVPEQHNRWEAYMAAGFA